MTRIFLSYARGDDGEPFDPAISFVARLHRDLMAAGFTVWFDRVSMPSRALTFHQEIRDAVAACDRLVLVVGPKAAESLYVRQEWQFAYFEAEKIVTPILRCGDYANVPDELKLLHCEDFRDDGQYDFHLKNLIRQLAEPTPALGKLIGVPSLPPHFLSRTDHLTALRDALRADLDRPVVITGAAARVGMHGMGGIGKSVLAATLSRDRKTREAFPDGIVWVGLGPLPTVADLQRRVHKDLGGDGAFQTEHEGRGKLRDILKDKGVLLVLDDVWRREEVDWFDVLGPRCRTIITTRDAGLLTSLGGVHHQVELLTDAEALNLLAQAAGVERDKLPGEAAELIAEWGRLPLAVALCGGLIRHGFAWAKVLEQLRTSRIDRIKDPHPAKVEHENIWNAIDVSVKFLSADERARFLELSVFPPDEATPIAALQTLWSHTAGFDDWDTDTLVIKLSQRSLLELTTSAAGKAISLHDLVYDYAVRSSTEGGPVPLHAHMAQTYLLKGMPTLNGDVIALRRLPYHACEANAFDIWLAAMTDFRFLQTVVEMVELKEGTDEYGAKIPWFEGYRIVTNELIRWFSKNPTLKEAKELIEPLMQVWDKHPEFVESSDSIMSTLFHDLSAMEKIPPKRTYDLAKRQIVLQLGPLGSWCERERRKHESLWKLASNAKSSPHYHAFISYRREGGSETARSIRLGMAARGIQCFLDVDDLRSRHFDARLLHEIESAPNFIVILTPGSLDRCLDADDWLRREIEHAIDAGRNIIPVLKDGFTFPPTSSLPASLAELHKNSGVHYNHELFSEMLAKLEQFLEK